jgi:TM2 domain-containing membrane protein YozV
MINGGVMETKFCSSCGEVIAKAAEICPKCGVRVQAAPSGFGETTASGKNRTTAALFALLVGGLGVHKFYLGQVGLGVAYLLFCWTLIPGLIAFVEAIMLFTMTDEAFAAKYS